MSRRAVRRAEACPPVGNYGTCIRCSEISLLKDMSQASIAGAETLEDVERPAPGTAGNRWRIPRTNDPRIVDEARLRFSGLTSP
jgi:hypothetical protein